METQGTALLWLRVSDPEQELGNQRQRLLAEAARRGLAVWRVAEVTESAYQGKHRQALGQVMEEARQGRFTVLLCWALDRLSREGPLETLQLVHQLDRHGVKVISLQESWTEAEGEFRDLFLAVAGWVARFESRRKSERVKAAMDRLRAEGKHVGRPVVVGYVDCGLVAQLKAKGKGWYTIQKLHPRTVPTQNGGTKRPSASTIRRAYSERLCQNGAAESGLVQAVS